MACIIMELLPGASTLDEGVVSVLAPPPLVAIVVTAWWPLPPLDRLGTLCAVVSGFGTAGISARRRLPR